MPKRPSIISRIIGRPITFLMVFLSLVGMGVIAYMKMPINLLPDGFSNNFLSIWTPYPNSSPMEVEDKITRPIEEILRTIPGIKNIRSFSFDSGSRISIEFMPTMNSDLAYCEVKDRMERVKPEFPESVKDYFCFRFNLSTDIPIMGMAVLFEDWVEDPNSLTEEIIKARIEGVDGVAKTNIRGLVDDAIRIFLNPEKVRKYNIDLYKLITEMGSDNFIIPAGNIKEESRRYNLRVDAKYKSIAEVEEYPVSNNLVLKDIGEVVKGRAYRDYVARVNGKSSILFYMAKESQKNTAEVCTSIENTVEELKNDNRLKGVEFLVFFSQKEVIESSLNTLKTSLTWGGLFAIIVLYIFLRNIKSTFIVALSIPTSILTAIVVLYFSDRTINLFSLAGFTLAVGMLVDNAIVVIENITRQRALGGNHRTASAAGASQVGTAILMATLTTIVVFMPLIFFQEDSNLRLILSEIGLPISFSLLASLTTALIFIPLATTYIIRLKSGNGNSHADAALRVYHNPSSIMKIYEMGLKWTLNHRFGAILIGLTILATAQFAIDMVDPSLDEGGGEGRIAVSVDLPNHYTLVEANSVFQKLENFALAKKDDYGAEAFAAFFDKDDGSLEFYMKDGADPDIVKELPKILRNDLPNLPGVTYDLGMESASGEQKDIRIEISGMDSSILSEIAFELKQRLKLVPDITNIRTDTERGMNEVQVEVNKELAQKFNIDPAVLRGVVSWGLGGQRLPDFDDKGREIRMQIEYEEKDIENLNLLNNMNIMTNSGASIPLASISKLRVKRGPGSIVRSNGRTVMGITVSPMNKNLYTVSRKISQVFENYDFPQGYGWTEQGGLTEYQEQSADIQYAFLLAVILVFLLMGILFESVILPFSILFSIPFACVGGIWLLALTGTAMDTNSMVGFILLAGIVVNNAIVLLDHINTLIRNGMNRKEAILQGGRERVRPIFMTALTTIFGLLPMAMPSVFASTAQGSDQFYQALAIVVLGGLILSTISTLFIVPLFYTFFDDLRQVCLRLIFSGIPKVRGNAKVDVGHR